MDFRSFSLHPSILDGIQAVGYTTATPIQAEAMPLMLAGHDLLGLAQTGTGKTAAFVVPLLHKLLSNPRRGTRALVLAPTRELAEQIYNVIRELSQKTRIQSMTLYGGVAKYPQISKLKSSPEIVVACPGRLLDHLHDGTIYLGHVEMVVIDEADLMFDMGFLPNIQEIVRFLPKQRQTVLFSATMPSEIAHLAQTMLHEPKQVAIAHEKPLETIGHSVCFTQKTQKTELLIALLKQVGNRSAIIFTRTKMQAVRLGERITRAGFKAASLQGNMSQNKRQYVMDGFRRGRFQILVATDIAARGIDISHVGHVINYDIPETSEAYTHRIGRTGRADNTGHACTLVTADDMYLLPGIEKTLGKKIETQIVDGLTIPMPVANPAPQKNGRFARSRRYGRQRSGNNANYSQQKNWQRPRQVQDNKKNICNTMQ